LNAEVFDHRSDVSKTYTGGNPLLRQWHVKRVWRIHYRRLRNLFESLFYTPLSGFESGDYSVCRGSKTLSDMEIQVIVLKL